MSKLVVLMAATCLSNLVCQSQESTWNLTTPLDDNLSITNPGAVGFSEDSLGSLLELIGDTPPRDFRSLLVIKDGYLVVEEYFNSFMEPNINDIRSAGKSITAMCVGIAMDRGLFALSDPLSKFFPERDFSKNPEATKITVKDLLTMSAGLASDDYDDDSPGTEGRMMQTEDYLEFILNLSMDFAPGSKWAYSSAIAFLAGALVEETSGLTLEDFARQHLFAPLRITECYWQKSPQGRTTGMGNLYLQSRDFAKLGLLMLYKGKWEDQQVISSEYCDLVATKSQDISDQDPFAHGYGFMWYLAQTTVQNKQHDYYFASGNGGNKIFVFPELNMVVTTMSSAYGQGYGQRRSHNILEKVLNALQ